MSEVAHSPLTYELDDFLSNLATRVSKVTVGHQQHRDTLRDSFRSSGAKKRSRRTNRNETTTINDSLGALSHLSVGGKHIAPTGVTARPLTPKFKEHKIIPHDPFHSSKMKDLYENEATHHHFYKGKRKAGETELVYGVMSRIQEFCHQKGYRLIDCFRDEHLNYKAHHDKSKEGDHTSEARGAWLYGAGGHDSGATELDGKGLAFFLGQIGLHINRSDCHTLMHYLDKDGNGKLTIDELDAAVHVHHREQHFVEGRLDNLEIMALKIKDGSLKLGVDAHTRFREKNGKMWQDPTNKIHAAKSRLMKAQEMGKVYNRNDVLKVLPHYRGGKHTVPNERRNLMIQSSGRHY
jgi:hypothetical protein